MAALLSASGTRLATATPLSASARNQAFRTHSAPNPLSLRAIPPLARVAAGTTILASSRRVPFCASSAQPPCLPPSPSLPPSFSSAAAPTQLRRASPPPPAAPARHSQAAGRQALRQPAGALGSPAASGAAMAGAAGPSPPSFRFDSHLHVWASPEEAASFPFHPGQEPSLPGHVGLLLERMDAAGVAGALLVQPINHKFDHSYVRHAIASHPHRFVGCCLADPSSPTAEADLRRLLQQEGFRAVRFNPYLWPPGEKMTNAVGCALFAAAGELGAPVGVMCFKGLDLHIDEIRELCQRFPATPVLLDHFGFCLPTARKPEAAAVWPRLLELAAFPQVYVKASAAFRVASQPFPYADAWPALRQLVDAFGAQRVMWGSDFPFIDAECGYSAYWALLDRPDMPLSAEERAWVAGRTCAALLGLPQAHEPQ